MKRKNIKWDYELVKAYYAEHGCTFVSPEYKSVFDKYTFICGCGNEHTTTFDSFRKHRKRCKKCASEEMSEMRRLKKDYIEQALSQKGLKYNSHRWAKSEVALTDRKWLYVSYTCQKGRVTEDAQFHSTIRAKYGCFDCSYIALAEVKKLTLAEVKEALESKGMVMLSSNYVNNHTPIDVLCSCGTPYSAPLMSILHGHRCGCQRGGENHYMYNPNLTEEYRQDRRLYPEYTRWVQAVYERDNYTCQKCNKRGGTLHAHHILSYAKHEDKRTDINNGATLCEADHKEFHRLYGRLSFTAEDFYEYVRVPRS